MCRYEAEESFCCRKYRDGRGCTHQRVVGLGGTSLSFTSLFTIAGFLPAVQADSRSSGEEEEEALADYLATQLKLPSNRVNRPEKPTSTCDENRTDLKASSRALSPMRVVQDARDKVAVRVVNIPTEIPFGVVCRYLNQFKPCLNTWRAKGIVESRFPSEVEAKALLRGFDGAKLKSYD